MTTATSLAASYRAPTDSVELVTIGDELLLGHTVDTNAAFISRELGQAGFRVTRRTTVGDEEAAIAEAVSASLSRAPIVICTGGLGPTHDDLTRPVVAQLFGRELEVRPDLLAALQERYRLRGVAMPRRNISQAEIPHGALVLPNVRGSAQGIVLTQADGRVCILLPGVPSELRGLITEQVLPFLLQRFGSNTRYPIRYRVLRTIGIPESAVAEAVDPLLAELPPLTLAFLPGFGGTDLRLTSWGGLSSSNADHVLAVAGQKIRAVLDEHIYGEEGDELAEVVGRQLRARGWRLAVAESCTGGLLGKRLTDAPGASDFFEGGVIAYSNQLKQSSLGVDSAMLREHGAVSEAVARALAFGAQRTARVEAAISITGVAGPGGGTPDKPVGTVWLAAALEGDVRTRHILFTGGREDIREHAAQAGLALLWKMLRDLNAAVAQGSSPDTSASRPQRRSTQ